MSQRTSFAIETQTPDDMHSSSCQTLAEEEVYQTESPQDSFQSWPAKDTQTIDYTEAIEVQTIQTAPIKIRTSNHDVSDPLSLNQESPEKNAFSLARRRSSEVHPSIARPRPQSPKTVSPIPLISAGETNPQPGYIS